MYVYKETPTHIYSLPHSQTVAVSAQHPLTQKFSIMAARTRFCPTLVPLPSPSHASI